MKLPIICLSVLLFGCVHYKSKPDSHFSDKNLKTDFSASFNFLRIRGEVKNRYKERVDDTEEGKSLLKIIQDAGYFRSAVSDYEDYQDEKNLIIDCKIETEDSESGESRAERAASAFAVFLPFPVYITTTMSWSVFDKNGLKKVYTNSVSHATWPFLPILPFAFIQRSSANWDEYNDEKVLMQNMISQLAVDLGNSAGAP